MNDTDALTAELASLVPPPHPWKRMTEWFRTHGV